MRMFAFSIKLANILGNTAARDVHVCGVGSTCLCAENLRAKMLTARWSSAPRSLPGRRGRSTRPSPAIGWLRSAVANPFPCE